MSKSTLFIVLALILFIIILFLVNKPFRLSEVLAYYQNNPPKGLKSFSNSDLGIVFSYPAEYSLQGYVKTTVANTNSRLISYPFASNSNIFYIMGRNNDFTLEFLNFLDKCSKLKVLESDSPQFSIFQKSFCGPVNAGGIKSFFTIGITQPNPNFTPLAIATYIPTTGNSKMIIIESNLPNVSNKDYKSGDDIGFLNNLKSGRYNQDLLPDLKAFAVIVSSLRQINY